MSLSWSAVQGTYQTDVAAHAARAAALGLDCPQDVFEQLFHDHHDDDEMAQLLRFVDWTQVRWEEGALSGVALRHAGVPRPWQHAVDEARHDTVGNGFQDERPEVMAHWAESHTWLRSPILLAGELMHSTLRYELIVGFTRLGNLFGALDRRDLPEHARHRVWIGR